MSTVTTEALGRRGRIETLIRSLVNPKLQAVAEPQRIAKIQELNKLAVTMGALSVRPRTLPRLRATEISQEVTQFLATYHLELDADEDTAFWHELNTILDEPDAEADRLLADLEEREAADAEAARKRQELETAIKGVQAKLASVYLPVIPASGGVARKDQLIDEFNDKVAKFITSWWNNEDENVDHLIMTLFMHLAWLLTSLKVITDELIEQHKTLEPAVYNLLIPPKKGEDEHQPQP